MSEAHYENDDYSAERAMVWADPDAPGIETMPRVMRSLAAVGTVFGAAAAALLPFGLIRLHQGNIFGDARVAIFDAPLRGTSPQALWMVFSSLTGAALGTLLLAGSIGALSFRRWSRPMLIAWALTSLVFGITGVFFFGSWLLPPCRSQLAEVRGVVDTLVTSAGWAVGSPLAIVMLYTLTRPQVKAAFGRAGSYGETT